MTIPSPRFEASTLSTERDPMLSRIEALPVNRAHRATAQADYLDAEAVVDRVARMLGRLRLVRGPRGGFGRAMKDLT